MHIRKRSHIPVSMIFLGMLLAAYGGTAAAAVDVSLRANETYTDNVNVSGSSPQSEHIGGLAGTFTLFTNGPYLEAEVAADLAYFHYFRDAYEDQFRRGLEGNFKLNFVDGHLVWITSDSYGAVLRDPLDSERPDNISYDNYLTTGPQLTVGFMSRLHVRAGLLYGRADYEAEDVPDNEQYTGELALVLPATATSETSLNVGIRRVRQEPTEVSSPEIADYDVREAFLRSTRAAARGEFHVDVGATSLKIDSASTLIPLFRFGISRRISPRLLLASTAGLQYQEGVGRFRRLQGEDGPGSGSSDPREDVIDSPSPLRDRFIALTLTYEGVRTQAHVSAGYNNIAFQHSSNPLGKQKYSTLTLAVERRIRPTFSLDALVEYHRRNLPLFGRNDETVVGHVGATWHLQPKLDLRLSGQVRERHSNAIDGDYKANVARLEMIYRPRSRGAARD